MILDNVLVKKNTIKINANKQVVWERLKKNVGVKKRKFHSDDTFKVLMTGRVGIHRIYEMCYITGNIKENSDSSIIQYTIYPGAIFISCCIFIIFMTIGELRSVLIHEERLKDFFFQLLVVNLILFIVEILEVRYQERRCSAKFERLISME